MSSDDTKDFLNQGSFNINDDNLNSSYYGDYDEFEDFENCLIQSEAKDPMIWLSRCIILQAISDVKSTSTRPEVRESRNNIVNNLNINEKYKKNFKFLCRKAGLRAESVTKEIMNGRRR